MAEWIDEAALPVGAPGHLVVANPVDAAVGPRRHGTCDEAVRVVDEHLDPYRPGAQRGGGIPAVVAVIGQDGTPLAGATVDVWQSNEDGFYVGGVCWASTSSPFSSGCRSPSCSAA